MGKGLDDARAALALAFEAVNSASDAFPPLKSVSGGLLFFVQLAQTIQSNKADYGRLLSRIAGIAHDLANVDDTTPSARLAVVLRVRAFKTCLERLQEDIQPVSRPYALRANQHKSIIRSCNDELDRCTRDLSLWAGLLLIRDVESLRKTVLEAIAALGGHVDALSHAHRSAATVTQDNLRASQAPLLDAVAALASQVDDIPQRTAALGNADVQASQAAVLDAIAALANRLPQQSTALIPGPVVTTPKTAVLVHASTTTSGFHLSASIQLHIAPKSCVLFA
ncbi:hypothetical protein EXIGLDRAFT_722042 [Exidia glandulosa HHB12029]|uniref:Uncharacterized protein n=1 Tax=Exidia glandulosa HHB12029 TaxID=1314781 RepID=A0A165FH60_EXIGL|nr:hypothetical protein EXIGLDRAFT_722042 [Exidia glandulosa HHB12029]